MRLRTGARLGGGRAGQRGAEITRVALKGPRPEPPARHRGEGVAQVLLMLANKPAKSRLPRLNPTP